MGAHHRLDTRPARRTRTRRLVSLTLVSGALTFYGSAAGAVVPDDFPAGPPQDPAGTPYAAPVTVAPTLLPTAPGPTSEAAADIVATATATAIPATALAAYQRATVIIDEADTGCRLDWPLLAAVGRVESDHGRYGGGELGVDGVAAPAIVGPALDGAGVGRVADTDAGVYDGDDRFDHAVGPMQIIPSTWSVVGVDADGDGRRDPQDVDDAALAAAVYLCSGPEDLSTLAGRTAAVLRYNHSRSYVDTVLATADAYRASELPAITGTLAPVAWPALPPAAGSGPDGEPPSVSTTHPHRHPSAHGAHPGAHHGTQHGAHPGAHQGADQPGTGPAASGTATPAGPAPTPDPIPDPTPDPTPEPTPDPRPTPAPDPTPDPTPAPDPEPAREPAPDPEPDPTAGSTAAGGATRGSEADPAAAAGLDAPAAATAG